MKIEATPEEIAELLTEIQTRLIEFNCTVELNDEEVEKIKENLK